MSAAENPYCAACRGHGTGEHDDDCPDFVTITVPRGGDYLVRTNPVPVETTVSVAVYQDGMWYAGRAVP